MMKVEDMMETAVRTEVFLRRIPYSRVACDGNELAYVREVLESGWLTTASKAQAFERKFAEAVGARFAIAVNSCTSALHLGLEAMGVGPGDKVLVPTMTFTASAEVVRYLGADPVFLDVEYGSSLITPEIVAEAIDRHPDAKALIVVHFAGQSARMLSQDGPGILEVCRRAGPESPRGRCPRLPDALRRSYGRRPRRCDLLQFLRQQDDHDRRRRHAHDRRRGDRGPGSGDAPPRDRSRRLESLHRGQAVLGIRRDRPRLQVQHARRQRGDRPGPARAGLVDARPAPALRGPLPRAVWPAWRPSTCPSCTSRPRTTPGTSSW